MLTVVSMSGDVSECRDDRIEGELFEELRWWKSFFSGAGIRYGENWRRSIKVGATLADPVIDSGLMRIRPTSDNCRSPTDPESAPGMT